LGGKDPYSASKGMAELAIRSYVESFFNSHDSNVRIGITRAGNVIGGGDWATDRIVPDCMKAWSKGEIVEIRSPDATRPWQHVLEPLSGYLILGASLAQGPELHGQAYNFGPPAHQNHSVRELIDEMEGYWDHVRWNDISQNYKHLHEAGLLKLNCDKSLSDLNWSPTLQFDDTVRMTVEWYKSFYQGNGLMYDFTIGQINEYTKIAKERKMLWTMP
jgi:CDP-glucose 4,6-dehydratase